MIPMPEIDLSQWDTNYDPFLEAIDHKIREEGRLRQREVNLRETIDAQIVTHDNRIEELVRQKAEYKETGKRGPDLRVSDEKLIRQVKQKVIKETRKQGERLQVAVEQDVEVPDGWGKQSKITSDGHVVVILKSPNPVCPSKAKVEHEVRKAFEELRHKQTKHFCVEDLISEDTDNLPPWAIEDQREYRRILAERGSRPQGP